jgi:transcription elongation factor S-II
MGRLYMLPLVCDMQATPQRLLPVHRHRGLQLLMQQMKGKASQRDAAQYVRQLELAICAETLGARTAYMRTVRAMAFNLRQNGRHLLSTHAPETLIQLDHVVLAKGTPIEMWHKTHMQRQVKEAELQNSKPIDFFEGEDDTSLIRCSRCRSSDVTWEQKQTRGADESMTVFFTCTNCDKRWKMC